MAQTIGTSIAESAERIFVVVDRLAVQIQQACAIASTTQVTYRAITIVTAAEMQGEQGQSVGNRLVGHRFQGVARSAMQRCAGTRQQAGVDGLLDERMAEVPDPGCTPAIASNA